MKKRIAIVGDSPNPRPSMANPVFIVEWRGSLYTPLGPVKRYALEKFGVDDISVPPTGEGLFDCVIEGDGNAPRSIIFREVTVPTPDELVVRFTGVGLRLSGDVRGTWPVGLTMILGPSASGKSLIVPHLARSLNGALVSIGEPGPGMRPFSAPAYSEVLTEAIAGPAPVTVIDSLRMAALGGSQLGPGGIPRDMGTQFSQIDYAARLYGKSIFGVVNLLTTDQRANESAYEVISGSCSAVIRTESTKIDQSSFTIIGDATIRPHDREVTAFVTTISRS
jgi:hypothetical protein